MKKHPDIRHFFHRKRDYTKIIKNEKKKINQWLKNEDNFLLTKENFKEKDISKDDIEKLLKKVKKWFFMVFFNPNFISDFLCSLKKNWFLYFFIDLILKNYFFLIKLYPSKIWTICPKFGQSVQNLDKLYPSKIWTICPKFGQTVQNLDNLSKLFFFEFLFIFYFFGIVFS